MCIFKTGVVQCTIYVQEAVYYDLFSARLLFYLITRRQRVSHVLIIHRDTKIIELIVVVDLNKLWTTVTTTTTHSNHSSNIIKSTNLWF